MEREQISDLIESSSLKIRNEFQAELNELKLEVARRESEISGYAGKIESQLANSKAEITETAIDKTLGILVHVRNWIAVIGIAVGVASFLGLNSLYTNLTDYYETEVQKWLRFESKDSGGRASLEKLRTQAILDAYTIKLARSYSNKYSQHSVSLSNVELNRLTELLSDPETEYGDFIDSLRLVSSSRGLFGFYSSEDKIAKKIISLLEKSNITSNKKIAIIDKLKSSKSFFPMAASIMMEEKNDEYIRVRAFDNVKLFNEELALNFSKENFNKFTSDTNKMTLAKVMIKDNSEDTNVLGFAKELITHKNDFWFSYYFDLSIAMYEEEKGTQKDTSIKLIDPLIDNGAKLTVSDFGAGAKYLAISIEGGSSALENPRELLSDTNFINSLIKLKSINIDRLSSYVEFFQVEDMGHYINTVLVSLDGKSSIEMSDSVVLDSESVSGDIWLRSNNILGVKYVEATWRDPLGAIKTGRINKVSMLKESEFKMSFDSKIIDSISSRYLNDRYNLL
jgi:hypothetical protein